MYQFQNDKKKVVKKEKGPAPPPPSMPNTIATAGQKESVDDKSIAAPSAESTIVEDGDNKSNRKEANESPLSTTPEGIPNQSEVSIRLELSIEI